MDDRRASVAARIRALVIVLVVVAIAAGAGLWLHAGSSGTHVTPVAAQILAARRAAGRVAFAPAVRAAQIEPLVSPARRLPSVAHVVVVVEENKNFDQIAGNRSEAPYLNRLIDGGALFTRSFGVAHPSQPNYFALFAGRLNRDGDGCGVVGISRSAPNLGSELLATHRTFTGYAEGLPEPGWRGCSAGEYARKHAPWTHFTNIPARDSLPFSALGRYDALPTVTFIIPDELDDMHSASIRRGDDWLRAHVAPLIAWGQRHETLVIVTWDESSADVPNHIPTIFVGPMVKPGRYGEPITHLRVLRTIEALFGLRSAGASADVAPITDCWRVR